MKYNEVVEFDCIVNDKRIVTNMPAGKRTIGACYKNMTRKKKKDKEFHK